MRVIEILEHHQACVDTFLSKKVTHIITTPKCFSKNDIIAKKMQHSRAQKMVRIATQLPQKRTVHKQPVLQLNDLIKFSVHCHKHFGNEEISGYQLNKSTNVHVRELKGTFIKVEDVTGSYRPMVIEMENWPKLQFDSDNTALTKSKVLKQLPTQMGVKKKLCELCNSYYDDLRYHLKGSEHQENDIITNFLHLLMH